MPNWMDTGDFSKPDRLRSNQQGAVRKNRKANPVYCEHEYEDAKEGEELCANRAVRHSDPPRCAEHGGVHAGFSRKRTESGYVKVNERMKQLMEGKIDLSKLDAEELARGQLRNEKGTFAGGAPLVVPRAMHAKMTTELFKRADEEMKSSLVDAVQTLTTIMKSDFSDPKDKLKAAQWMIERVMGKTPETLIVGQQKPWEQLLVKITGEQTQDYTQFVKEGAPDEDDPRW